MTEGPQDPQPKDRHADSNDEAFEEVLASCIDALAGGDMSRVEELYAENPSITERLRERMASLQRLGLLQVGPNTSENLSFGRYSVERQIGAGGMSVVYLARDQELGRRVALKTCPAFAEGDDRLRARFEREIQAVGQLDHPGIVRIFDVGESDGRPYFTMEFVEGATLAQIIAALRERDTSIATLTGASVRSVVEEIATAENPDTAETPSARTPHAWPRSWVETVCHWMLDVAGALTHAHRAGILHRDVKPSNVIVGLDGRARLFDLGLARLEGLPGLTRSGDFTGTPYYVSPEQLTHGASEVDQRSDVFSLGVTFYELLTLRRPFDGESTAQIFKQIVDRDPTPPRRFVPTLAADLETMCLTALEKNPAARYPRMDEFAEDLQRFLEFLPVHARPPGVARRTVRFVRRRPALATAAALGGVILVGLPIGLFIANQAISRQRDLALESEQEAIRQAELSEQVTDFLADLFQLTPEEIAEAETVTAREILDRGARRIPSGFERQPLARAALMRANGRVYANMGVHAKALQLLDRALAIFQRELGEADPQTARLLHELARVHLAMGDPTTSVGLCKRGLAGFIAADRAMSAEAVRCRLTYAEAATLASDREDARAHIEDALAFVRDDGRGDTAVAADLVERLGLLHVAQGDAQTAEACLTEAVAIRSASWVPDPIALAEVMDELATVRRSLGANDDARVLSKRAETLRSRVAAHTPVSLSPMESTWIASGGPFALRPAWRDEYDISFRNGITALQVSRYDEAIAAFERCLDLDPGHAVAAYNLACAFAASGDNDAALRWVRQACQYGFGLLTGSFNAIGSDPELARLRELPGWDALMDELATQLEASLAYVSEPAVYRPEACRGDGPQPLLVVFHEEGSNKHEVLEGPWREVADQLGFVLLAPSAAFPTEAGIGGGMRWFRDAADYLEQPWAYEKPILDAIRAYTGANEIDRECVFTAGEGLGALLAADIAFTAPGFFRGALLLNGPLQPQLAGDRIRTAKSLGLVVQVVFDERRPVEASPPGASAREVAADIERALPLWGLEGHVHVEHTGPDASSTPTDVRLSGLAQLRRRLDGPQ